MVTRMPTCVLGIVVMVICISCEDPGPPIPEAPKEPVKRAWSTEDVDQMVLMEEILIPSKPPKNPFHDVAPPDSCNYIHFLRFRLKDENKDLAYDDRINTITVSSKDKSPVDTDEIDAVLVLSPGLLVGANGFELLGRQLVYMAKNQKDANIEVWAVERRPNCIENLIGIDAAEAARDTQIAIDYYWYKKEIDGKLFPGHPKDKDIPYLSEFGMKMTVEDIYKIITTMVPDQKARQEKVFIGGHSLAGFITAIFAEWDFDGDPKTLEDAGYKNCAGFIGLDTTISSMEKMLSPMLAFIPEWLMNIIGDMGESVYKEVIKGIQKGYYPRKLPLDPFGLTPEAMTIIELMGMRSDWYPNEESKLINDIFYGADIDFLLNLLHSKTITDFFDPKPEFKDFRYTNEAFVGVVFDDNFMPISIMQASLGMLGNDGPVVKKHFPLSETFKNMGYISDLMGSMLKFENMFIADDPGDPYGYGPLYSWVNFDRIGNIQDPSYESKNGDFFYTNMQEEVTDIRDFSRMLYKGPGNLSEWYFSFRLTIDMLATLLPFGKNYGLNTYHGDKRDDFPPTIEIMAENGPFSVTADQYLGDNHKIIEGYNHIDILTAAPDRPGRRENEVIMPLIDFVLNPK